MTTTEELASVTVTVGDEPDAEAADGRTRRPWEGVLAVEGKPTSDRRYLMPGEITHRDLPVPLRVQTEQQGGHDSAKSVGRIEQIERIPASEFDKFDLELPDQAVVIWGSGTLDGSELSAEAERIIENGAGVSLDLPWDRLAIIDPETYEEVDPAEVDFTDLLTGKFLQGIAGKIAAATVVDVAAFEEASIRLTETEALVASALPIRFVADPNTLVASAAPLEPPRDWFFLDEPDEPTPFTITPEGIVYGHIALWSACHRGQMNGRWSPCVQAPHSRSKYAHFHLGGLLTAEGDEIAVGRMTVGTEHAPTQWGAARAREHYDNSGNVVAFVRAYDGIFGIWVAGAIKSDATPEQVRDLRACPPSGDWRSEDRHLELQAVLAVPYAGFATPRSQLALTASGDELEILTMILGPPTPDDFAFAAEEEADMKVEEALDMVAELSLESEVGALELAVISDQIEHFKSYTAEQRRAMAKAGTAMPDGSFPIADCADAENAIRSQGRGGASQGRIVAHIKKRVGALGCSGDIFDPYK